MARPDYVSVRLTEELKQLVRDYAAKHDMQTSQIVRAALKAFFTIKKLGEKV